MKNFQTVVQELLHNHERQRRYIALLTALCMLMAFTVSIILIEPAESMTGELACGMTEHIHSEECFTYTCGLEDDENHVHSADCRTLTCGKTEHAHSENCYIHEDEQTAQIMQINSPQIIDNDTPEGDSGISSHTDKPKDAWLDENQAFKEALKEPPEGAHQITPEEIIELEVKESEDGESLSKDGNGKYQLESDGDSKDVYFVLHYKISKEYISTDGNQYIYIKIPDGFDIPQDWYDMDRIVVDSSYSGKAGYFSINKETRMLVIRFTDEYVSEKLSDSGDFSGTVTFEGKFNRDNTAEGDKEFDLWKDKIVIDFPEKTYYAEKEGKIKPADNAEKNPKVEWTITVNNYYPEDSENTLTGYTVRDERFPAGGTGVTIEPEGVDLGKWVTDENGKTYFEFKDGVNPSQVTFTFTKELTKDEVDAKSVSNTVDLKKGEELVDEKPVEVKFSNDPTLDKKGAAKYPVDDKDYIEWTITVTNPLGGSLENYYLIDDGFTNMIENSLEIEPAGTGYELTGNKLTFTSEVKDVTITYKQVPKTENNGWNSNNVKLYNVDNDDKDIVSKDANVSYFEKYTLDKSGNYNADTKEITWTVKASTDTNDNNVTLDGYTLQDNALKGKSISDITITNSTFGGNTLTASERDGKIILSKTAGWGGDTSAGDYAEVTLDSTTGTITIKGIDGRCIKNLDFTYTTKADEADASGTKGTVKNGDKITNTVTDSKNVSKSGEVTVKSRNFVEKKFLGDENNETKVEVYDQKNRKLNWQVDLTQDEGFSGTKTFVDVMSATGGGDHYLDLNSDSDSQKNSIHLKAKVNESDTEWTELHEGTDYEIKYYEDSSSSEEIEAGHAKRFEIIFKKKLQNSDGKDYHYVEITYQTTADISEAKFDEVATFNNTARYNETENPPITGYEITPHNPDTVQTFSLNVTKSWKDNENAAGIRPDSVKFYLERKLGSGDWEKIYKNDSNEWVEVTTDTPEDEYTFTIEKDSWTKELAGLPIDTKEHNEKYFYRVREVDVDEDIYTVTYSDNEQGVSGTIGVDSTITITNTKNMTFDKVVLGADGQPLKGGKLDLNALGPVEITEEHNGTKTTGSYYVIGYQFTIDAGTDDNNNHTVYTDILPKGFTLVFTEEDVSENSYYPFCIENGGQWQHNLPYNGTYANCFTYDKDDNKVTFNMKNSSATVKYYIKAPADEFGKQFKSAVEKTVTVKNTITDENDTEKSAEVKVTGQIKDNPLRDILKKDVANDYSGSKNAYQANNGVISYSVYVNPDGKNLSNSDELDVLDDLIFGDFTGIDNIDKTKLTAELQSVQVEKVENFRMENGSPKADSVEILPESDYSYTTEEGFSETTEENLKYTFDGVDNNSDGYAYRYSDFQKGDQITITITGESDYTLKSSAIFEGVDGGYNLDGRVLTDGRYEFTVTSNGSGFYMWLKYDDYKKITSITAKIHRTVTTDIASRLTVSVPDETPLKITYSYKLMYDNQELSGDVTAKLSNKASITSGTSTATDSKNDVEFYVNKVTATVGTDGVPKIVKYNIGNVATNPSATFYLAIYDGGKWKFASTDSPQDLKDSSEKVIGKKHIFTYEADPPTEKPNGIPQSKDESGNSDALKLQMETGKPFYLELKSGILYKLIEIKAPDGYEANDEDIKKLNGGHYQSLQALLEGELNDYLSNSEYNTVYKNLLNKFIAVHYFKYGSETIPDDKMPKMPDNSKYQVVGIGGSVEIPNSELIDIGTQKIWDSGESGSVEVELLWSHKKSSNGIPSDAELVNKDKFALSNDFSATQTLNSGNDYKCTWHNLPNGYDDKPIYYYVRETSYTINGEKFEWNKDTGKYMCGEKEGEYKPIYTGNGTNKSTKPDSTRSGESTATDNGVIKIHNSKGLQVKKIWKNSDNTTMAAADIPDVEIKFNLYGTTSDGVTEWIYQGTLSKDDWTAEIPEDLVDDNPETNPSKTTLSDYVSFEVEELIEGDLITKLYQYTISYNYNISGTTGEITITNKNPNPTKVDVSVEKVWSDGDDRHEGIDVKLYKSNTAISDADLAGITNPENDSRLTEVTGITNTVTLNDSNNWKHTWNDLPFKGEGVSKYYYYAIETSVPKGYTASYFVNGNKTTITNSVPGSLTIDKKWLSKDRKDITSDIKNPVNFKLYRRANSSAAADDSKTLDGLKIFAFGDSITAGTGVNETERYSNLLQEKLKANGTNIKVENKSQLGAKIAITDDTKGDWTTIEGFIKNSDLDDNYGVVIVMAGTNNVLNTKDTIDEMKNKMSGLLDMVYSKDKNSNLVVFLEKIPKIIDIQGDYNSPGDRFKNSGSSGEVDQGEWDDLVTKYNEMLDELVEEYQRIHSGREIKVIDTCTAVGENLITEDGLGKVHPDKKGHQAIAELLYNEILSYYGIEGSKAPTDIKGLPSDFYKNGVVNTDLYEEVTDKAFTLPDESGNWSKTFTNLDTKKGTDDYVYYIVEESTGNWTAAYDGNGQIINDSGATITVTNTIDKGNIEVEKVWKNANNSDYTPSDMQSIEVQLYRSTTKPTTDSESEAMNIMNEPMALAVDDSEYDTVTVTEGLKADASYMPLTGFGVSNKNIVKIELEFTGTVKSSIQIGLTSVEEYSEDSKWVTCTDNVNSYVLSEFPSDFNYITVHHNDGAAVLKSITFYYPKGTLGEGGDTGGGGTEGGNTGESTPAEPQEGTALNLETVSGKNPDDTTYENKTAKITDTEAFNVGDTITVNLKYTGDMNEINSVNGCFGFSPNGSGWKNDAWNTKEPPPADNTTFIVNGEIITVTWTVPSTFIPGNELQFQIWWLYDYIDSATYTVTSGGTTPTEPPTEPDTPDPEPTDSHIPIGAELFETITLSSTLGWKHTFKDLPLTDASGNPYYYYVKEVNVPEGFEVTYSDGVEPGGTITITNTKKESSTTTMPSTGGNGARKYYTVGGMLLLMSACGWAMHRRKRVIPH